MGAAAVLFFLSANWILPEGGAWWGLTIGMGGALFLSLLSLGFLHWEGISPREIGLTPKLAAVGLAFGLAPWLLWNLMALPWGEARFGGGRILGMEASLWFCSALVQWFLVGPCEELAWRGFVQNAFISLFGGGGRWSPRIAGIAAASALFAVWHVPRVIFIAGGSPSEALWDVLPLIPVGLVLGAAYESTRNVFLCGVLHGTFFNLRPMMYTWPFGGHQVGIAVLVILWMIAIWIYSKCTKKTPPCGGVQ